MDIESLISDLRLVYIERKDEENLVSNKLTSYYDDEKFEKSLLNIITDESLLDHEAKFAAIKGFGNYFKTKWHKIISEPSDAKVEIVKKLVTDLFELVLLNGKISKELRLEVAQIIKSVCSSGLADVWFYEELLKCLKKDITNDSWILYECICASCIVFEGWSMHVGYDNEQYEPVFENIIGGVNEHFKHFVDHLCADAKNIDVIANLIALFKLYDKLGGDIAPMCMIFRSFPSVVEHYKTLLNIYYQFLASYIPSETDKEFTNKINSLASNSMGMLTLTLTEHCDLFDNHYQAFRCIIKKIIDKFNQDDIFSKTFSAAVSFFFFLSTHQPLEDAQNSMKSLFDNYFLPFLQPSECEASLYSSSIMNDSVKDILELSIRRESAFFALHEFSVFSYCEYPVDDWLTMYMDAYLEDYELDPVVNWKSKSSAILLYMCLKDVDDKFVKTNSLSSRTFGNRKEMFSYLTNDLKQSDIHHPVYLCDCMRVLSMFLDIDYMRPFSKEQEQILSEVLNSLKVHRNNYVSTCATELEKKLLSSHNSET